MPDFPGIAFGPLSVSTFNPLNGGIASTLIYRATNGSVGAWPAANLAIYTPVEVKAPCTAYQVAFNVGTQNGNCDVGIYDEMGNRLVSSGSTAVGAAGIQVIDITDTDLKPGVYFLAMNVDNTTATIMRLSGGTSTPEMQATGCQQQAVGAVTLPNPATFADPGQIYIPFIYVSVYQATI